jgi:hypothetical protein
MLNPSGDEMTHNIRQLKNISKLEIIIFRSKPLPQGF